MKKPKTILGFYANRTHLSTICTECGKVIPKKHFPYLVPDGFIILCYDCYVKFKEATQK